MNDDKELTEADISKQIISLWKNSKTIYWPDIYWIEDENGYSAGREEFQRILKQKAEELTNEINKNTH